MFNYDYTLEEGGVESSAETNQQVPLRLEPGLHYQSFCDHSRNFAGQILSFKRICRKFLREMTHCLVLSRFPQTYFTNPL